MSDDRQTGLTTQQMMRAPLKAVYVWCNNNLIYPHQLARRIGREDLEIWTLSQLSVPGTIDRSFTGIVIDHAARLDSYQTVAFKIAQRRINFHPADRAPGCLCREWTGNAMKIEDYCPIHGKGEQSRLMR